ncbi:MAG: SH3 domain-containing protein [Acidobacteriota bacterium]
MTRRSIALLLALAALASAQTRRLLPLVDESARDPRFAMFLNRFKLAVLRKDAAALLPLISPDVKNSFGGNDGLAEFRTLWKPEEETSDLWPLLSRLLERGGTWQGPGYCVPYVCGKFPDDLDAFEYGVVAASGVWLRKAPNPKAPGIRQLSYEIVKLSDPGEAWSRVVTLDGKSGYVAARYLFSPVGYRAFFQPDAKGVWQMAMLLQGD